MRYLTSCYYGDFQQICDNHEYFQKSRSPLTGCTAGGKKGSFEYTLDFKDNIWDIYSFSYSKYGSEYQKYNFEYIDIGLENDNEIIEKLKQTKFSTRDMRFKTYESPETKEMVMGVASNKRQQYRGFIDTMNLNPTFSTDFELEETNLLNVIAQHIGLMPTHSESFLKLLSDEIVKTEIECINLYAIDLKKNLQEQTEGIRQLNSKKQVLQERINAAKTLLNLKKDYVRVMEILNAHKLKYWKNILDCKFSKENIQ